LITHQALQFFLARTATAGPQPLELCSHFVVLLTENNFGFSIKLPSKHDQLQQPAAICITVAWGLFSIYSDVV
jgi:hypothetical protein